MNYVDTDILDLINDINKQLLEIRNEISFLKGYVSSMNIHQYIPPYTLPYKEPNWPNQTWMSTNNHPNEMQPCTKSYNQD